jgi:predicted alpha/beta-hydrolase family hydrolase
VTIAGALLFPGAGSSAVHPSLLDIERALAPLPVALRDFPYRREGRRFPDKADALVRCVVDEAREFAHRLGCSTASIVVGGRSMGGRMCSMAVAEGLDVAGLVCVAYPLHPPKQPDRLRTDHLPSVAVPSLFVSGTRDEFGSPDELRAAVALPAVRPELRLLDGARHDLRGRDAEVAGIIAEWVELLRGH